jgi:putative ABC transport system substrate-binding protein
MQRREFITLVAGAAVAWPVKIIGFLGAGAATAWAPLIASFEQRLRQLG